jgi:hypothetical protein
MQISFVYDVIPNWSEKTGEEPAFVPAQASKAGSSPGLPGSE